MCRLLSCLTWQFRHTASMNVPLGTVQSHTHCRSRCKQIWFLGCNFDLKNCWQFCDRDRRGSSFGKPGPRESLVCRVLPSYSPSQGQPGIFCWKGALGTGELWPDDENKEGGRYILTRGYSLRRIARKLSVERGQETPAPSSFGTSLAALPPGQAGCLFSSFLLTSLSTHPLSPCPGERGCIDVINKVRNCDLILVLLPEHCDLSVPTEQ